MDKLIVILFLVFTVPAAYAAGYCKDNVPGVCASTPFCVDKKIGSSCRGPGICTALGKKEVGDCCRCKGGRSPSRSEMNELRNNTYPFPDFNHKSGDLIFYETN